MAHSRSVGGEQSLAQKFRQRSTFIEHGQPPVFALPLEKKASEEDSASLLKHHLGEENVTVPNRTIMMMGGTGAGKTTLINGMANYILGVRWEDNFRFRLIHEITSRSQAESQTSEVVPYVLNHQEGFRIPYSLTIVDTPGFGSTKGIEDDKSVTEKIRKFFSTPGCIDHIDSVCFVVQAPAARLTPAQEYVFDAVLSIFGNNIKGNIQILVTFADGQRPPVLHAIKAADVPCAKDATGTPIYFKFNNSALFASNAGEGAGTFDEMFWKMGEASMKTFFVSLNGMETKSLTLTKKVLRERKELEITIAGLPKQMQIVQVKIEELMTTQQVLDQKKMDVESNKNFEYEVQEIEFVKEDSEYNAMNCRKCKFTCHHPCMETWDIFNRFCAAIHFFSGECKVCPGHCSVGDHSQEKKRFAHNIVTKRKTIDALKEKYEKSMKSKMSVELLLEKLRAEEEKEKKILKELIEKGSKSHRRLQEIALKPTLPSIMEYIDEQGAKLGYQERVQRLQLMKAEAELTQRIADGDLPPQLSITE